MLNGSHLRRCSCLPVCLTVRASWRRAQRSRENGEEIRTLGRWLLSQLGERRLRRVQQASVGVKGQVADPAEARRMGGGDGRGGAGEAGGMPVAMRAAAAAERGEGLQLLETDTDGEGEGAAAHTPEPQKERAYKSRSIRVKVRPLRKWARLNSLLALAFSCEA